MLTHNGCFAGGFHVDTTFMKLIDSLFEEATPQEKNEYLNTFV